MAKKVIQVPFDEKLLEDLNSLSKKYGKARAALIRQACMHYLQKIENAELDRLYQEAYEKIPEEPEIGDTQTAILGEVLSGESW